FFTAFEGMEQGFRDRAARMEKLLAEDSTAFVVVAAPRRDAVDEATFFADRLREMNMPVAALVINRVLPRFGAVPDQHGEPGPLTDLITNLIELDGVARREELHIASLAERLPSTPVIRVPMLVSEVHDMAGLSEVGESLLEGD
ncbi:MAG: hypothetical protein M3137_06985, partial [Actinomycetota bacterium]|nr:hypothetical protein [Actinomycetota bacterium]